MNALALLALVPLCASLAPLPQQSPSGETSQQGRHATVIFLRHAEALPRTPANQNPILADAGNKRAKLAAKTLRAAGVTRIFATELIRTQQTAAPLAKELGLEIENYTAKESRTFARLLGQLKNGEVVVVVGHSNTLPVMVSELGGNLKDLDKKGYLPDTQHERMVVQFLSSHKATGPMRAMQTIDLRIGS